MVSITVYKNENLESALKRFKKKVEAEGIIKEYKEKQYYMKPSEKRRLKKKEAERKMKIKQIQPRKYKKNRRKNKNREGDK